MYCHCLHLRHAILLPLAAANSTHAHATELKFLVSNHFLSLLAIARNGEFLSYARICKL